MPVLFAWYEWLRNDALGHEAATGEVRGAAQRDAVPACDARPRTRQMVVVDEAAGEVHDPRAVSDAQVPERVVNDLLSWGRTTQARAFAAAVHVRGTARPVLRTHTRTH